MANYARQRGESKLGAKLEHCGEWLVFRHYYTVDKVRLHAADFCKKHLLCPLCAIRRGAKYLKAYMDKLAVVQADNSGLKAYMVTLTVVDGEDLGERFKHLRGAMQRMTQARRNYLMAPNKRPHVEFAKAVGGVHSIEAKRGANSGLWHPHAHMIWLCHEEPDQAKLAQEWRGWTGDSFIVDVRPFHDQNDLASGFVEVFKYALKFSELPLDDNWDAFETLSGKRLVDSFGLLRGVEVPDTLTDEPLDDLPYIELFYRWLNRAGYNLIKTSPPTEARSVVPAKPKRMPDVRRTHEAEERQTMIESRLQAIEPHLHDQFRLLLMRASSRRITVDEPWLDSACQLIIEVDQANRDAGVTPTSPTYFEARIADDGQLCAAVMRRTHHA